MIIKHLSDCTFHISYENAVALNIMADEDENLLVYYFKNRKEILFKTTTEDLIKLQNVLIDINEKIVNFSSLPMYFEVSFYIYLSLKDFDNACKYLRSFKYCINKISLLKEKDEKSQLYLEVLEKHFENCRAMINLYATYKETGKKDSLTKYFLSENYERIEKELKIRMLIRQLRVTRNTVLGYYRNYNY